MGKEKKEYLLRQIITGCEKGEVRFQEKLYKYFYGYMLTVSRLYCYSDDDSVTVLNDSFLKAFSALQKKKYNHKKDIKYWLRKIVINTAIDQYRKNIKSIKTIEIDETYHINSTEEDSVSRLSAMEIMELLQQLSVQHKMVFLLYEIQGYSHSEIAEKLNISTSSSRVFLVRAKKKLQTLIQHNYK